MSADWLRVKISDVCEFIVDCVNKTAPRVEYETPYKMIRTPNIKDGRVDRTDCRFVEKETYDKWTRRAKVLRGDVLLTREAPLGQIGYVDFDDTVFLGQRIMQYRANPDVLDSEYLLYAFLSPDLQHQFRMHEGSGSVVSHIRVPDCSKFELSLPVLKEQKRIAKVLRDLDKKIELNRQTNQTLEAMAQAIFKSWFVDFEPTRAKIAAKEEWAKRSLTAKDGGNDENARATFVERAAMAAIAGLSTISHEAQAAGAADDQLNKLPPEQFETLKATAALFPDALVDSELGEIPEGWGVDTVGDHVSVTKGRSYKSAELEKSSTALVTLKSFMRGGGYREDGLKEYTGTYKPAQVIKPGELVMSLTDVTQAAEVVGKPAVVTRNDAYEILVASLDVAILRPHEAIKKEFFYGLMSTYRFHRYAESFATGTTVLHLNTKGITSFEFAQPEERLCKIYSEVVAPMLSKHEGNIHLSRNLEQLRDALLPKLLSGELSTVPDKESAA